MNDIGKLLKLAVERVYAMSPEEQAAHWEAQRQSWVRGQIALASDRDGTEYRRAASPVQWHPIDPLLTAPGGWPPLPSDSPKPCEHPGHCGVWDEGPNRRCTCGIDAIITAEDVISDVFDLCRALTGPGGWPPLAHEHLRQSGGEGETTAPCDTEPRDETEAERIWRITQEIARGG